MLNPVGTDQPMKMGETPGALDKKLVGNNDLVEQEYLRIVMERKHRLDVVICRLQASIFPGLPSNIRSMPSFWKHWKKPST